MRLPTSLRARLVLFSLALFLAVQIPVLVVAYRGNADMASERLSADLDRGTRTLRRVLDERGAQLALATRVLASEPALRGALAVNDPATVQSLLENHVARLRADFGVVLSPAQVVLASTGAAAKVPMQALASNVPTTDDSAGRVLILALEHRLLHIALVPILAPNPVGWAAIGWELDQRAANDLKQLVDLDVSFLSAANGMTTTVSASTLPAALHDTLRQQFASGGVIPGQVRTTTLGDASYASTALGLDDRQPPHASVALHQSVATVAAPFKRLTVWLTVLSAVGLAACAVGSSMVSRAITRPIRSLTAMTEAMRMGDDAPHVGGTLTGELQGLANSFNRLVDALRKRDVEVQQLAYFDGLTGLSNRAGFAKAAPARLNVAGGELYAAVALIDVASVTQINSVLGHEVGDEVIRAVADKLRQALPESDLIARFGSVNFAVLLIKASEHKIDATLKHLIAQFDMPLHAVKQAIDVRMHVGWAQLRDDGIDLATVMRRADMALNVARVRQLPVLRFNHGMEAETHTHFALLSDLKQAVIQGELELHYQPKLSMRGDTVGLEALLRWNHPKRGLLMPDAFIGIAEQTGAVRVVTRFVVGEAVHQLLRWTEVGFRLPVAVNISARDLQDDSFPGFVAERLTESGVDAALLRFEITERALLDNVDAAVHTLRALQHIGIRVSLDDYGTGYATLTHISQLPVSELKIDRSFVTHLTHDTRNFAIVMSTVQMGHRLGMTVVAEGVETVAELDAVRLCGCDEVQGFYFSKPMPANDVQRWLLDRQQRA